MWQWVETALGLGAESLAWWQMGLRAVLVYPAALAMVRIGEKRFLGRSSAFDVILAIVLGSVLSRAINAGAAFFETLLAGTILVRIHWMFAVMAFRSDSLGTLVKGGARRLVRDGEVLWDQMRKSHITRLDLDMALRRQGQTTTLENVSGVWLEWMRQGRAPIVQGSSCTHKRYSRRGRCTNVRRPRRRPGAVLRMSVVACRS